MCIAIFGTLSFFALRLAFHRGCGMGLWWLQPPPCSGHCSRDRGEVGQGWWPISSSVGLKLGSKRTPGKSTSPQVCLHFVFKVGKLSLIFRTCNKIVAISGLLQESSKTQRLCQVRAIHSFQVWCMGSSVQGRRSRNKTDSVLNSQSIFNGYRIRLKM